MKLNRRRFITIASAAALTPRAIHAATPVTDWRGTIMGAEARLILAHPQSDQMIAAALEELGRLEGIFSLYRPDSQLMRLNAAGSLNAPATELIEVLALSGLIHQRTGGVFDPTIQPLWAVYAKASAAGRLPTDAERSAAVNLIGWDSVLIEPSRILLRPGMALTLNGIAQGFITDRVAARLAALGLSDVLCEMGEITAQGRTPDGGAWPVSLANGRKLPLSGRALASSSPHGTVLDANGRVGHIFDPQTGLPSDKPLSLVSVSAPTAAVADALSTAGCLMERAEFERAIAAFADVRIEAHEPLPS